MFVEDHPSIRHLNASGDITSVGDLLPHKKPEVIFVLQDSERGCAVDIAEDEYRIVKLNGEHFVYPAPVLLQGIADLRTLFAVDDKHEKR